MLSREGICFQSVMPAQCSGNRCAWGFFFFFFKCRHKGEEKCKFSSALSLSLSWLELKEHGLILSVLHEALMICDVDMCLPATGQTTPSSFTQTTRQPCKSSIFQLLLYFILKKQNKQKITHKQTSNSFLSAGNPHIPPQILKLYKLTQLSNKGPLSPGRQTAFKSEMWVVS